MDRVTQTILVIAEGNLPQSTLEGVPGTPCGRCHIAKLVVCDGSLTLSTDNLPVLAFINIATLGAFRNSPITAGADSGLTDRTSNIVTRALRCEQRKPLGRQRVADDLGPRVVKRQTQRRDSLPIELRSCGAVWADTVVHYFFAYPRFFDFFPRRF
jgi:hypothetical protein